MEITTLLIIGYKLSLLTFSIGVLIYALPIPWSGLKSWGPRLIWDSIAATILLSLFYFLIKISNKIPLYLGGSWSYFEAWLNNALAFAITLKELVLIAYAAARTLDLSRVVSSLLWPIDRLANALWLFMITIYGLAVLLN